MTPPSLLLLALACQGDDATGPAAYTWNDTAVASEWDSPLQFEGGEPPRNVLMISIDTLRKDALSAYGAEQPTPFFDRLIDEGVDLADHMQCASWTFASTTCTLAGRYPEDLRYMPRLTQEQEPLPSDTPMLATWMGQLGFTSMLQSPNAWLSTTWGNAQGYDVVTDLNGTAYDMALGAFQVMDDADDEPWFLHVHVTEPHAPYNPPERFLDGLDELEPVEFDLSKRDIHYDVRNDYFDSFDDETRELVEAHVRVRYAADVAWLDEQLGDLFVELDALGALDDTLVVLWTDHGEAFWEHGYQTHAYTLHPEETDAVAVFWAEGLTPGRWDGPTHAVDLVPTLIDLYGGELPDEVTGIPLGAALPHRMRFASVDARAGVIQMVRQGDHAMHLWWRTGEVQLFDRTADPQEAVDLFRADHPAVEELWPVMTDRVGALNPLVPAAPLLPAL